MIVTMEIMMMIHMLMTMVIMIAKITMVIG